MVLNPKNNFLFVKSRNIKFKELIFCAEYFVFDISAVCFILSKAVPINASVFSLSNLTIPNKPTFCGRSTISGYSGKTSNSTPLNDTDLKLFLFFSVFKIDLMFFSCDYAIKFKYCIIILIIFIFS